MQRVWHCVFELITLPEIQRCIRLAACAHAAYHTYPVGTLLAKSPCPYQRLEIFVQYWHHLPLQGSPDWLADKRAACAGGTRIPTFGGSDVDTLLGFNPYSNPRKLFANRLGLEQFSGNNATQWGNMCEEITSLLCEEIFRSSTYETGSLPGHQYRGGTIQRYSPDRLGVVRHAVMAPYLDRVQAFSFEKRECGLPADPIPYKEAYTVLFEYKNPFNRAPDGVVPKQYTGQMQLGLATIPFADFAVFVDCMIRKCSYGQFGKPAEYCRSYHPDSNVHADVVAAPIYSGFIGFYELRACEPAPAELLKLADECSRRTNNISQLLQVLRCMQAARMPVTPTTLAAHCPSTYSADDLATIINSAPGANILIPDYGEWEYFSAISKRACDDRFAPAGTRMYYSPFYRSAVSGDTSNCYDESEYAAVNAEYGRAATSWLQTEIQKFQAFCTRGGYHASGIMPYKLYQITIVPMPRHPKFMEVVAPMLETAYDTMCKLVAAPDRQAALDEMFPIRRRKPLADPETSTYADVQAGKSYTDTDWGDIE